MIDDIGIAKPILDAMSVDLYSSGNTDYSPSTLLLGAREYWLKKGGMSRESSVSTSFASFRGNLIHTGLEEYIKRYQGEGEYQTEIHVEIDFNQHAKRQLSVSKIVGGKAGYRIDRVVYIPLFIDWSYARYVRSNKADAPTLSVPIPIWAEDTAEGFIYDKITAIEEYRDSPIVTIPYCTAEQRWAGKKVFKVGKLDGKGEIPRAYPKCTFDTQEEAAIELAKRNSTKEVAGIKIDGGTSIKCWTGYNMAKKKNTEIIVTVKNYLAYMSVLSIFESIKKYSCSDYHMELSGDERKLIDIFVQFEPKFKEWSYRGLSIYDGYFLFKSYNKEIGNIKLTK